MSGVDADYDAAEAASPVADDAQLPRMSFLEHLEELRKRILYSIIALIVAFFICWGFAQEIFHYIERPVLQFLPEGEKLAFTRLTSPFFLYMKVAFLGAIFLAAPFVLWQVWSFISPGLYKKERRLAAPFIIFASLFFIFGGWFGYTYIFPIACKFFIEMGRDFQQVITIDDYFAFASKMILGMGLVFETPIIIFFFARLGLVTPAFLIQKFKYAILIIFVLAAIITPTPDMVTQTALAVPMVLLYLLGIGIAYVFAPRHDT